MSLSRSLPKVILITDWEVGRDRLEEVLRAVLPLGNTLAVQHRHPNAGGRAFYEEARWLWELCRPHGNPLFINERLDVALSLGAHLHLPSHSVDPADLPELLRNRWISVSIHDGSELPRAQGAHLALVSPVFAPNSKPSDDRTQLGWAGFISLARQTPVPAFALGGMSSETARTPPVEVRGVAVMGAAWRATDPRGELQKLIAATGQVPAN